MLSFVNDAVDEFEHQSVVSVVYYVEMVSCGPLQNTGAHGLTAVAHDIFVGFFIPRAPKFHVRLASAEQKR